MTDKTTITRAKIDNTAPPDKGRLWLRDDKVPGLALMITDKDARAWYIYRRIKGEPARYRLGGYPELSVKDARDVAEEVNGKIARGEDPREAKRQARAAMTLGELFDLYLTHHAKPRKRSWREDERQYNHHLKAKWGNKKLDAIKPADIRTLHQTIGKKAPVSANRLVALLRTLFNVARDLGYSGPNPTTGIKRYSERKRERFLGASELARFLQAIEDDGHELVGDFLKVALFTGQRRENVASMQWDEIDFEGKLWHIDETKNGDPIDVPLAAPVMEILERRKSGKPGQGAYVFPSRWKNASKPHIADPTPGFRRVCEAANIRGLRIHDLRRTLASWATMQGVAYPIIAKMIGHRPQGVTSIYARVDIDTIREAFDKTTKAMLAAKAGE